MGLVEVLWDADGVSPWKGPGTSGSIMGWRYGTPTPGCGQTHTCENSTFPSYYVCGRGPTTKSLVFWGQIWSNYLYSRSKSHPFIKAVCHEREQILLVDYRYRSTPNILNWIEDRPEDNLGFKSTSRCHLNIDGQNLFHLIKLYYIQLKYIWVNLSHCRTYGTFYVTIELLK